MTASPAQPNHRSGDGRSPRTATAPTGHRRGLGLRAAQASVADEQRPEERQPQALACVEG